jgi:hypothetical protein
MKTEKDINEDILKITLKINDEFPELSKYISEMPITIPNSDTPEINAKNLEDYYNSLETLLKKYTKNHIPDDEQ